MSACYGKYGQNKHAENCCATSGDNGLEEKKQLQDESTNILNMLLPML